VTLRTVIADDEPPARRRVRALLESEPGLDVQVVGEAGDGQESVETILRLRPDLVLLDVQMPGGDGFEVAARVTEALGDDAPVLVFVTAWDQYALQAFDARAIDYLLKPFDRARLRQAIDRARRQSGAGLAGQLAALSVEDDGRRWLRRLAIRDADQTTFVDVRDVDWIEAADHYLVVHANSSTHIVRESVAALAARLDPARFARIHRGTIVNLGRITQLRPRTHGEYDVVLRDGTQLHATRTYSKALRGIG